MCYIEQPIIFPVNIYLSKVINTNNTKRCEICSKLTIKTPERRQWRHSDVFIVNSEHISHIFSVFLLLTNDRSQLFFFCQISQSMNFTQALKSDASPRVWLKQGLAKTIPRVFSDSRRIVVIICFWIMALHLPFISSNKQKELKKYTC